jgi:hypothetical protein
MSTAVSTSRSQLAVFEVLDLSHKLLLVFFADGEPAEPQGTLVQLESGRFRVSDRPTAPRDIVLGAGRFFWRAWAMPIASGTGDIFECLGNASNSRSEIAFN